MNTALHHSILKLHREKREWVLIAALAAFLSLLTVWGYQLSVRYHSLFYTSAFLKEIGELSAFGCATFFLCSFLLQGFLLHVLYGHLQRRHALTCKKNTVGDKISYFADAKIFIPVIAALFFICWVPVLLALWPGPYNYDIHAQLPQAMYEEVAYNTHHPLLHTLLVGKIITFGYNLFGGDLGRGVTVFACVQMLVFATVLSLVTKKLWVIFQSKALLLFSILFFALHPNVSMYAMTPTKDSLCHLCFLVAVVELFAILHGSTEMRQLICFGGSLLLACLFRKNMVYAVAALAVLLLLFYRKRITILENRCLLICLLLVAAFSAGINLFLSTMLQAKKLVAVDAYCVPISQIAYVYNEEGEEAFTKEEMTLLSETMDVSALSLYNPCLADPVKNAIDGEAFAENLPALRAMWLRLLQSYPGDYLQAFGALTYQTFFPATSILKDPAVMEYYYYDFYGWDEVEPSPKWKGGYHLLADFSRQYSWEKLPLVRLLFSMGTMFFALVFMLGYGVLTKQKAYIVPLLLIFLYVLTELLGPISLIRYDLILFYALPLFVGMALGAKKEV